MTAFLARLSPRERLMIGLGLPLVLLVGAWVLVWQPVQADISAMRDRIAEARGVRAALDRYPAGEAAAPAAMARGPVAGRVTRSAEAAGITLARLEPAGTGLTAFVDSAPFDDIVDWIARMEADEGLRLTAIDLARRADPGFVSARLDLEEAG